MSEPWRFLGSVGEKGSHLYECHECGAVVNDVILHGRWHDKTDDPPVPHHTHGSIMDPIGPGTIQNDEDFRKSIERTVERMLAGTRLVHNDGKDAHS